MLHVFWSRFGSPRPPAKPNSRTRVSPEIELLETREVPAVAGVPAHVLTRVDSIDLPRETATITMPFSADRITPSTSGRTLFEIEVKAVGGSGFVPGNVKLMRASGQRIPLDELRTGTPGVYMVYLRPGNYALEVRGKGNSTGSFVVSVSLGGDVNGDRCVDRQDVAAIARASGSASLGRGAQRRLNGMAFTDLDVNRDGRLNKLDLALSRRDVGAAATTVPFVFANSTDFQNTQITVAVFGQDTVDGWVYFDASGQSHSTRGLGTVPTFTLDQVPNGIELSTTGVLSGRIYFSPIVNGTHAKCTVLPGGVVANPDPGNVGDSNNATYYDFVEYTLTESNANLDIDTSQIDQFGFPLTLSVTPQGGTAQTVGGSATRGNTIEQFNTFVAGTPFQLGTSLPATGPNGIYRILAPKDILKLPPPQNQDQLDQYNALDTYFDAYVDEVFSHYQSNQWIQEINNPNRAVHPGDPATYLFSGEVITDFKIRAERNNVSISNTTQYQSTITLTTGTISDLQPGMQVSGGGLPAGTVVQGFNGSTGVVVVAPTPIAANAGPVALTFQVPNQQPVQQQGRIGASVVAFTYTANLKLSQMETTGIKPGWVVTSASLINATVQAVVDGTNLTITSPSPINAGTLSDLIFSNPQTGQTKPSTGTTSGTISGIQEWFTSTATLTGSATTTQIYAGMTALPVAPLSLSNPPASYFVQQVTGATTFTMLSSSQVPGTISTDLLFEWRDEAGVEQTYTVLQFTGMTGSGSQAGVSYQIFKPYFRTNTSTPTNPIPPPWLAGTAESGSEMVFSCDGVFADNVGQFPTLGSEPASFVANQVFRSNILGSMENDVVTALNRGIALTQVVRNGSVPMGTYNPTTMVYTATATVTDTSSLQQGMMVCGLSTASMLTIQQVVNGTQLILESPNPILPLNNVSLTFSFFYPAGTASNRYAEFWHQPSISLNSLAYGFPFDDNCLQSSNLSVDNVAQVSITLGKWT